MIVASIMGASAATLRINERPAGGDDAVRSKPCAFLDGNMPQSCILVMPSPVIDLPGAGCPFAILLTL